MAIIRPPRPIDESVNIPNAFIQDRGISAYAKLVYLVAASYHQAGRPEPHRAVIAEETGLSLEQVETGIRDLAEIPDDRWHGMGLQ